MSQPPADAGDLPLLDHHCHGVLTRDPAPGEFADLLTEGRPGPGVDAFDSRTGLAVRRWCAPLLDLPAHAPPEEYLARRADLGHAEVTRRMLRAAGLAGLCVDTGYTPEPLTGPAALAEAAGAPAFEVVRLERVAETVAASGVTAAGFAEAVRSALARAAARPGVVAFKSIAAYRVGLALAGRRPGGREVRAAADRLVAGAAGGAGAGAAGSAGAGGLAGAAGGAGAGAAPRVADEALHRFLVWCAADLGLPVQFHTGYGDADLDLRRCDPLLLTDLLRSLAPTGVPVLLLHTYPYQRHAGYLAQVFGHVYVDVGLATHNVGDRAGVLLRELLELAPFGKVLYSSDAYALPELYALGALLFRRGLSDLLAEGVAAGSWLPGDAARYARMIGADNARRVYRLP